MGVKKEKPLVSVIVGSYNSSETIIDTLNSVKRQTYKELELIVTDDNSSDNTRDIVQDWMDNNSTLFCRCMLIKTQRNSGPAINFNMGINESEGEWIKQIAADDLLLPNCIETFVDYINSNQDAIVIFSRVRPFGDKRKCEEFVEKYSVYGFYSLTQREQYLISLDVNYVMAPTSFIRRDILIKFGLYDERFPYIEDWPFWIKLLSQGIKLSFINKETVKYRLSANNLSASKSPVFLQSMINVKKYISELKMKERFLYRLYSYDINISKFKINHKQYLIMRVLRLFNPYHYYFIYLGKKIHRNTIIYNNHFEGINELN